MASGPNTSWRIDGGKVDAVANFIFLGSKITADGDCSHEIKRRLPSGRKAMTNLDNVLKSRNITLLTKELWCWRRLFRVLDNKEIQPVHPKEVNPELEGLMLKLKLQYFGHLKQRADPLEKTLMLGKIEGRQRRG